MATPRAPRVSALAYYRVSTQRQGRSGLGASSTASIVSWPLAGRNDAVSVPISGTTGMIWVILGNALYLAEIIRSTLAEVRTALFAA